MIVACLKKLFLAGMVTIFSVTAAKAAVINSVQAGTVLMTVAVQAVAITAVNTARSFVICEFSTGGNGSNAAERVTCELNAPATLTITAGAVDATETVRWYVVEFLSGVTVQRGLTAFAAGTATVAVPIAAVNLGSAFPVTSERTASASQTIDEQFTFTAQLTTTTNLQLTRNATGTVASVAWQVIQIESSAVQSGTASIGIAATTATAVLNPAVDLGRTFLVFSRRAGTATAGDERRYQTTGEITNGTTLTFTRAFQNGAANTQVDIVWYAVRMTDGTTVQRGLQGPSGTGAGSTPQNAVLAPAIVLNRSVPIVSVRGDAASGTPNADLDDTSWTAAFTTTTNLQFARNTGASLTSNATIAWFVVQWANVVNLIDRVEIFP
ncbi:MAG: hypothetical protein ACREUV_06910 [Burkholderiales bacterium]